MDITANSDIILRERFIYNERTGLTGKGACARVYQGRDLLTNKNVAIKKIITVSNTHVKGGATIQSKKSIDREIEIAKSLKHQHIVDVLDVWVSDNIIYMVMEYCDGGTLEQHLTSESLGKVGTKKRELRARHLLFQLLSALAYLREKQIVHRDLKSSNILLTSTPNDTKIIKLCDFGASKYSTSSELSETICGTPYYMAPEVYMGKPYTEKADVWSFGVIVYECLYGKTLFSDCYNHADLRAAMKKDTPFLLPKHPVVSGLFSDLLFHVLRKDPVLRMGWAELYTHPVWNDISRLGYLSSPLVSQPYEDEENGIGSFEELRENVITATPPMNIPLPLHSHLPRSHVTGGAWTGTPPTLIDNYVPSPSLRRSDNIAHSHVPVPYLPMMQSRPRSESNVGAEPKMYHRTSGSIEEDKDLIKTIHISTASLSTSSLSVSAADQEDLSRSNTKAIPTSYGAVLWDILSGSFKKISLSP